MASKENPFPTVDSNTFTFKENNQLIVVLRFSKTEFRMLSIPRLRLLHSLKTNQSADSQLNMCYMNNEIITWFSNDDLLTFWKFLSTKPSSTIKLPFTVRPTYSQLTNRNLLILQNEISKELVFVDVKQKKVIKTIKVEHNLYHSINAEDKLFRFWTAFMQVTGFGEFYCDSISADITLKTVGKLSLRGSFTEAILLDGARTLIRHNSTKCQYFEIAADLLILYQSERLKDERYSGSLHIFKAKKFCLITRDGRLLLLWFHREESHPHSWNEAQGSPFWE